MTDPNVVCTTCRTPGRSGIMTPRVGGFPKAGEGTRTPRVPLAKRLLDQPRHSGIVGRTKGRGRARMRLLEVRREPAGCLSSRERDAGDAAVGARTLDVEALLEILRAVPKSLPPAQE